MLKVVCPGAPLPAPLQAALHELGVELGAADAVAALVASRRPLPPPGMAVPWIWLPPRAVDHEAIAQAVLAGAYDVIACDAPGAATAITRRIDELVVSDTGPQDPPGMVAIS